MSSTAPTATTVLLTDEQPKPTQTIVAWIMTVITVGYFLPWAIAATRGKANSGFIGWLNFLLGWTVVGWVIALVLSLTPHGVKGTATMVTE